MSAIETNILLFRFDYKFSTYLVNKFKIFKCAGTRKPKMSKEAALRDWFNKKNVKAERVVYTAEFVVDSAFGEPGAITVANRHQKEFFLESITVEGFACGPVHFTCNSWIQPTRVHPDRRVFFCNKVIYIYICLLRYIIIIVATVIIMTRCPNKYIYHN